MAGTRYTLEVNPAIPARLQRLPELASDLFYSWDREVRNLFYRLDSDLWEICGHNPKVFLRRIAQKKLEEAAEDRIFVDDYNRVLSIYDAYLGERAAPALEPYLDIKNDLVAYFCTEFGLHESVQLYSGGLGILAGDYCKAASDLNLPLVAVGILYRQGYVTQTIDAHGNQVAHHVPTHFEDLPIASACDEANCELRVPVELPGRTVQLRVWRAMAGRTQLLLLDSDLPENSEEDRRITYQLYGGDIATRIQQEIVLGIGGVRALRAAKLAPTIWHINEGHAAFMIVERTRELVAEGLPFDTALEAVATATVFTTHTPVPAGHDIFDQTLMRTYFGHKMKGLGIGFEHFLSLGASPSAQGGFNMTSLAMRGSRFRNGVSGIHGGVASQMSAYIWPEVPAEENPIGHVTNGVHVPTFLAREWANLFDMRFGSSWRNKLLDTDYWKAVDTIPDHSFWSVRQSLKTELIEDARKRVVRQMRRNGAAEAQITRNVQHLTPHESDVLVIGFARRFATYKRATLIFSDLDRLARLLNDPKRPALMMIAGKAHPHDLPAQEFIRAIHQISRRPEFVGRIFLLEGYDMALARKLVTGVDVWVNTPEYPMEASGTSGEKAGIIGVLNLSVLDGGWGEGYNGENGWAITPHGPGYDRDARDRDESLDLLDILERDVFPLYYERNGYGYPQNWVRMSKASIKSLLPRFNAQRMVMDYVREYYAPARKQRLILMGNNYARATEVSAWRRKVEAAWPKTRLRRLDDAPAAIAAGAALPIRVAARLDGLDPDDVIVECLVGKEDAGSEFKTHDRHVFVPDGHNEAGETLFTLKLNPALSGLLSYKIRIYPFHPALAHRFEAGMMLWL